MIGRLCRALLRGAGALLLAIGGWSTHPAAHAAYLLDYTFVHDPSMIRQGHTYYLFSTGDPQGVIGNGTIQIRTSTDLKHWTFIGTVFKNIPDWITAIVGPIPNLWAPDISYYHGLYQLYYAGSTFGTNTSVIGLATNTTLDPLSKDYHWVDHGLVLMSSAQDDYNAIDPNFTVDASGHPWLDFGSFWHGIQITALNPATRKPVSHSPTVHNLAYRPGTNAEEAPFIIYRRHYYYLFMSFDFCCRGVNSTYRIVVGRAGAMTGPYVDRRGTPLLDGGGTQLLASAGYVRGPGGESVVKDHGRYLLVFHYYDARDNGNAKVRIALLRWSRAGWPSVGPAIDP